MFRSLFEEPALREAVATLGLPLKAPPFFMAELFDVLFKPSLPVIDEMQIPLNDE